MSTSKRNSTHASDRKQHVERLLTALGSSLVDIKFPLLCTSSGKIECKPSAYPELPVEFIEFLATFTYSCDRMANMFLNGGIKSMKITGLNRTVFHVYFIKQSYYLVFFCELDATYNVMIDHSKFDEEMMNTVAELESILPNRTSSS